MAPRADLVNETRLRVRYGEVDRMGVAYHANYLVYFEQGRTEYLRALGGSYRSLEEEGVLLLVVETGARYLAPARYDDLLTVRTRIAQAKGVRMRFEYEVLRDEELLATGFTVLASADRHGRPRRPPAAFLERVRGPAGSPPQSPPETAGGKNGGPVGVQASPRGDVS